MKKVKSIGRFIRNGFSVFRDASNNKYECKSEIIEELREEMMGTSFKTISYDKRNLIEDRRTTSKDVRVVSTGFIN